MNQSAVLQEKTTQVVIQLWENVCCLWLDYMTVDTTARAEEFISTQKYGSWRVK